MPVSLLGPSMPRAVVTGSTGFVGTALLAQLRMPFTALRLGAEDWRRELESTDLAGTIVFHLAARVHLAGGQDEALYRADNVGKTQALAQQAAAQGARRLVYLSSIKVHGEESPGRPFRPTDAFAPEDAYGRSKRDAELCLADVASRAGLPVCIVRAPLVYGPGARANLAAVLRLADSPWPLPFASIENRRSFVHVDDLARLLMACAGDASVAGEAFLAAHRETISTRALVAGLRRSLGRAERLFPMPPRALEAIARPAGQWERVRRLTRSLEADPSLAEARLGWQAQVGPAAAIEQLALAWAGGTKG